MIFDLWVNGILVAVDAAWWFAVRRTERRGEITAIAGAFSFAAVTALTWVGTHFNAFAVLRAWSWFGFVHAPLVLIGLAVTARGRLRGGAVASALALVGVGIEAFLIEPHAVSVRTVEIASNKVDRPLRIVVLADIQTDRIGDYERRVFRRASALAPDLILLPGDFVQAPRDRYLEQAAAFRSLIPLLQAPLGVWAVRGNAERDGWAEDLFAGTGVHTSEQTEDLGPLTLSPLTLAQGFARDTVIAPAPGFHVAFAHAPDFSLSERIGADLLIAGHTHGGQVQLPLLGPPITLSFVSRAAAAGVPTALSPDKWLVVSRGIGLERGLAPRLRFLCRPEIVVIEISPADGAR